MSDTPINQTDTAATIATIWAGVLKCEVHPDSDYFDLGGDSLSAMEISARMAERTGIEPELADFYDRPTPALLAELPATPVQS